VVLRGLNPFVKKKLLLLTTRRLKVFPESPDRFRLCRRLMQRGNYWFDAAFSKQYEGHQEGKARLCCGRRA
jgi:hypothetical protein